MKKLLLFFVFITMLSSVSAQNITANPNLTSGYQGWDGGGCTPTIGGTYGYSGAPYWFETTYGGTNPTNLVAEVGGGHCMQQILPLIKNQTYQINFKAARRCETDNPDLPPSLSIVVRVLGTTSFTMYSEVIYTYTNTTWSWTNETQTFTIPAAVSDNSVYFSISAYNVTGQFGVIVDDITMVPVPAFTVNGPANAGQNIGTNWSVDNLPATGVNYSWSFPGATPATSTLPNPSNIQWSTSGLKTVSCILNNGTGNLVTVTKDININAPLPISLLSFNAAAKNNTVDVSWATTNEINNDYFVVYRSKDGVNFDEVGKVKASLTGTGSTYALTDVQPGAGVTYYKLKQVDKNGTFKFSGVIKVSIAVKELDVRVYPTFVTDGLNYVIDNPKATRLNVIISDMNGKRVRSSVESFATGTTQRNINVSNLSAGVYLLTVIDDNNTFKKSVTFKKN